MNNSLTSPLPLTYINLRGVVEVSFTRSEATNLARYKLLGQYPGDLEAGEAFLFIAKGGNQIIFILRSPVTFKGTDKKGQEKVQTILDSRRLRLDGGTWSPYMLQNYAEAVGLKLVGIKTFEQLCDERLARKKTKKVGA